MLRSRLFASTLAALSLVGLTHFTYAEDKPANPADACGQVVKNPERHEGFLKDKEEALKKGPVELLFVGDSITDGWRNGKQHDLFLERWGKYNPLNIGISGDKTQHVLWRLNHGEVDGLKPKVVVLMIGTNNIGHGPKAKAANTPEEAADGVKCVVKTLVEKLPESKILLLAVFPRGMDVKDPYREEIRTINKEIAKLDDGGKHVKYVDIGPEFLAADGTLTKEVMNDALHPNINGYHIWADSMGPELEKLMK